MPERISGRLFFTSYRSFGYPTKNTFSAIFNSGSSNVVYSLDNVNYSNNIPKGKNAGNYTITVNYAGNDKYIGCNATKKITIDKKVVEAEPEAQQSTQSSSSSSNGGIHYDEEINVYYDDNGVVVDPDGHHPQSVGSNYDDLRDARDRWERGEPVMV